MKKHGLGASIAGSFTALCCAGLPVVLAFLSGIGLGFVINDFILFPILFVSLGFMFYALYYNKKHHMSRIPLVLAILSLIPLSVGIFAFRPIIWAGIIGLFVSSLWDLRLVQRNRTCKT